MRVFYTLIISLAISARPLSLAEIDHMEKSLVSIREKIDESSAIFQDEENQRYADEYLLHEEKFRTGYELSRAERQKLFARAKVVLQGELHTSSGAKRNTVHILKAMSKSKETTPLTVVIEWINQRYQPYIDAYLANELSANELRIKILYDRNWPFSWRRYLEILETAKENGIWVLTTEKDEVDLRKRDHNIAAAIKENFNKTNSRYLIVYGLNHVLGGHLDHTLSMIGLKPDVKIIAEPKAYYFRSLRKTLNTNASCFLMLNKNTFFMSQNCHNPLISDKEHLKYLASLRDERSEINHFLSELDDTASCQSLLTP